MNIGYKWVPADLCSRGHHWVIGEWSEIPATDLIIICEQGFHASERLVDVLEYINNGSRLFVVEWDGDRVTEPDKFCARRMRLVREIMNVSLIVRRFARLCARRAAMHARAAARDAARAAARDAARAAAREAARYAREAAERAWQEQCLQDLVKKHGGGDE